MNSSNENLFCKHCQGGNLDIRPFTTSCRDCYMSWFTPETGVVSTLPDTGSRTEFATGAVRDSSKGKGFPSMIPPIALRGIAKRFEDGAKKYSRMNFAKGIPLSRYHDSMFRHMMAWSEGDQAENHGSAVLWNMACAMWTEEQIKLGILPEELNDLPYYKK